MLRFVIVDSPCSIRRALLVQDFQRLGVEFLIGGAVKGAPVLHPNDLPDGVATVLVGLNPKIARRAIGDVTALTGDEISLFFLD